MICMIRPMIGGSTTSTGGKRQFMNWRQKTRSKEFNISFWGNKQTARRLLIDNGGERAQRIGNPGHVIPAKAGIQPSGWQSFRDWIPTFVGMTIQAGLSRK